MKKKKMLLALLCLTLLLSGCSDSGEESAGVEYFDSQEAFTAVDTTASEMRLEEYFGNLFVKNNNQLKSLIQGVRLESGDNLETTRESNAYVVLDESKILRLNETSNIEIHTEAKHLDVTLLKGSVFFNVSKPLDVDETLTFRTNHIVTGVRGTSGVITYDPVADVTQISVLSGTVATTLNENEETYIHTGEVGLVETKADGSLELKILSLEYDELYFYYSDDFVDTIQKDLQGEPNTVPFSEAIREPEDVTLSGKVLKLTPELVVLENGTNKIHRFGNNSSTQWEGLRLGGIVDLTYEPTSLTINTVIQTMQEPDVIGAFEQAFLTHYSDFINDYSGNNLYFNFNRLTMLSSAEKDILFERISQQVPTGYSCSYATWDELEQQGKIVYVEFPDYNNPHYVGDGSYLQFDSYDEFYSNNYATHTFYIGINNTGMWGDILPLDTTYVVLNSSTGAYTATYVGRLAG